MAVAGGRLAPPTADNKIPRLHAIPRPPIAPLFTVTSGGGLRERAQRMDLCTQAGQGQGSMPGCTVSAFTHVSDALLRANPREPWGVQGLAKQQNKQPSFGGKQVPLYVQGQPKRGQSVSLPPIPNPQADGAPGLPQPGRPLRPCSQTPQSQALWHT